MHTTDRLSSAARWVAVGLGLGLGLSLAITAFAQQQAADSEPTLDEVVSALIQTKNWLDRHLETKSLELEKQALATNEAIAKLQEDLNPAPNLPEIDITSLSNRRATVRIAPADGSNAYTRRIALGTIIEGWTVVDINVRASTVTFKSEKGEEFVAR